MLKSLGEAATDDEVDEMILMADVDGARQVLHLLTLYALTCSAFTGDGQVSFEEFAKLMMSLAAPPPQQQQAGTLPLSAPGFPAGTGLGGVYPPPYGVGVGGPGVPGSSYPGGVPGSYPASTAPPMSSGNPVQARVAHVHARRMQRRRLTCRTRLPAGYGDFPAHERAGCRGTSPHLSQVPRS